MTTILLIRHGNSTAVDRIPGREPGVHLSEEGGVQARRLAQRLSSAPIAAVYSSPLERTMETAGTLAAARGLTVTPLSALVEVDFGDWTGRSFADLEAIPLWKQFHEFRTGTRIPGGELMAEVQVRMVDALDRFGREHEGQTVAAVSHGDPIRSAIAYYAGIPLDLALRTEIDTCSVSAVALHPWGPRILCVNGSGDCPRLFGTP